MNNAFMLVNSTPSSGTLFAIPGLEFQQSVHAVKPGKSKVVNYNVQQPKNTPIGRGIEGSITAFNLEGSKQKVIEQRCVT